MFLLLVVLGLNLVDAFYIGGGYFYDYPQDSGYNIVPYEDYNSCNLQCNQYSVLDPYSCTCRCIPGCTVIHDVCGPTLPTSPTVQVIPQYVDAQPFIYEVQPINVQQPSYAAHTTSAQVEPVNVEPQPVVLDQGSSIVAIQPNSTITSTNSTRSTSSTKKPCVKSPKCYGNKVLNVKTCSCVCRPDCFQLASFCIPIGHR